MAFNFQESFSANLDKFGKREMSRLANTDTIDQAIRDTNIFPTDPVRDNLVASNSSFSGTDCTVIIQVNDKLISLGNLETFSYSIFREKSPIRTLGRSYAKGYTAGSRTISGSMIFVVFDEHPLFSIIKLLNNTRTSTDRYTSPVSDQLPPLDVIVIFNNEYGHKSILRLYGVEFFQEGQVHSINDLYTENTTQYVARDIDVMVGYESLDEFKNMMFERQAKGQFIDNQLGAMLEYKKRLEGQISQTNDSIYQLDMETGKRSVAGVLTLGTTELVNWGVGKLPGVTTVSLADIQREKNDQLKIKTSLLAELDKVNNQIRLYEQNIKGWNAQNGGAGTSGNDNLRESPTI